VGQQEFCQISPGETPEPPQGNGADLSLQRTLEAVNLCDSPLECCLVPAHLPLLGGDAARLLFALLPHPFGAVQLCLGTGDGGTTRVPSAQRTACRKEVRASEQGEGERR
jgi:hypothetical protein